MEEEPSDQYLAEQMASLKKQFTVLSHQMTAIVEALRVPLHLPQCACTTCVSVAGSVQLVRPAAVAAAPTDANVPLIVNGHPVVNKDTALTLTNGDSSAPRRKSSAPMKIETVPTENGCSSDDEIQDVTPVTPTVNGAPPNTPVLQSLTPNNTSANIFADSQYGGRRSKYCDTPEEKQAVAEYAVVHGAANAAKKFNIPASVAAYYSRKLKSKEQMNATATAIGANMGANPEALGGIDVSMITPTMLGQERTRGRPKMIGDKLDAELMEHMIKEKSENPALQPLHLLRPEMAMDMARAFILKHSPTLLKENGGHVELRMSWANKLVSRIAEREKEIALGLPPGSLLNVGLSGLKQLDSGAFMNDLTTMLLAQLQGGDEMMPETPEITNVKELTFADFLGENTDAKEMEE